MSTRWVETEWLKFQAMRYRQHGYDNESPADYLSRKQRHRRKLIPIYPDAPAADVAYEVADMWLHTPSSWAAHIDVTTCRTAADLIKCAADKDEQLQASSISSIM
jgi:hypothetical protein